MNPEEVADYAWALWDMFDLEPEAGVEGVGALILLGYAVLEPEDRVKVKAFIDRQNALEEAGYVCEERHSTVTCGNCRLPIMAHCKKCLVPCCPGRCPR